MITCGDKNNDLGFRSSGVPGLAVLHEHSDRGPAPSVPPKLMVCDLDRGCEKWVRGFPWKVPYPLPRLVWEGRGGLGLGPLS